MKIKAIITILKINNMKKRVRKENNSNKKSFRKLIEGPRSFFIFGLISMMRRVKNKHFSRFKKKIKKIIKLN